MHIAEGQATNSIWPAGVNQTLGWLPQGRTARRISIRSCLLFLNLSLRNTSETFPLIPDKLQNCFRLAGSG